MCVRVLVTLEVVRRNVERHSSDLPSTNAQDELARRSESDTQHGGDDGNDDTCVANGGRDALG